MSIESNSDKSKSPGFIIGPDGRKIILDKDGKPCRSCNSLEDFKSAKGMFGSGGGMPGMGNFSMVSPPPTPVSPTTTDTGRKAASLAAFAASAAYTSRPITENDNSDCPPDSGALGRATWTLLHTMAANYPETASLEEQRDMKMFIKTFARFYPCWWCAKDFRKYIASQEPQVESREKLGWWMCMAHNEVNVKLGKPEFDCNNWLKRWKTGWDDGRCD
ncbi:hypothetical protein NADFUDRAFT_51228 [Nadsonia fulvescens var. elongata DSM 6958]|uniref:Sulfhydryl oxidase n=1 Tax=Nadsonia fulvescens var. elongata DSM 6958 TaxID=857566 RepID=A0A1E3PL89_9ASCO|nr:hypothetical protein NADFUDRAFT_51228 [Nadsonia fulvescens var. elongata DSM 6958]